MEQSLERKAENVRSRSFGGPEPDTRSPESAIAAGDGAVWVLVVMAAAFLGNVLGKTDIPLTVITGPTTTGEPTIPLDADGTP